MCRSPRSILDAGSWSEPVEGPVNGLSAGAAWIGDRLVFSYDASWPGALTDASFDPVSRE